MHLIGLVSDGGVHSSLEHLEALIALAARAASPDLVVHAFTDGRDTLPHGGAGYLDEVEGWCADAGGVRVGSVIGRYFAMDRDRRWDRVQQAYDLLVHGTAQHHADGGGRRRSRAAYARGETDEFITATTVGDEARIRPGDSVIAFNFRPDRMREITRALADPGFAEVDRRRRRAGRALRDADRVRGGLAVPGRLPARRGRRSTLAHVIARAGGEQLHVAETEKYPHVTYFFGGGEEDPDDGRAARARRLAARRADLRPQAAR